MEYTKEQKQAYFKDLREQWQKAKELAETDEITAAYQEAQAKIGGDISPTAFLMIKEQMEVQGLEGTPYIDAKTFNGWKESGFKVKKGEKSKLHGITWIKSKSKNDDDEDYIYPKRYGLFHKSQVEPIEYYGQTNNNQPSTLVRKQRPIKFTQKNFCTGRYYRRICIIRRGSQTSQARSIHQTNLLREAQRSNDSTVWN